MHAGWSAPVELVREPNTPCWNPVLFHTNDGRLWLYYKFGPERLELDGRATLVKGRRQNLVSR